MDEQTMSKLETFFHSMESPESERDEFYTAVKDDELKVLLISLVVDTMTQKDWKEALKFLENFFMQLTKNIMHNTALRTVDKTMEIILGVTNRG